MKRKLRPLTPLELAQNEAIRYKAKKKEANTTDKPCLRHVMSMQAYQDAIEFDSREAWDFRPNEAVREFFAKIRSRTA